MGPGTKSIWVVGPELHELEFNMFADIRIRIRFSKFYPHPNSYPNLDYPTPTDAKILHPDPGWRRMWISDGYLHLIAPLLIRESKGKV